MAGRRSGSPAEASSAASRSTSAMIRAFSAGGGRIAGGETGSASAARVQLVHLGAAGRARLEVRDVGGALGVRQRAEDERAGGVLEGLVLAHASTAPCASVSRIFLSPSRIRPLTVPTGASSMSAISTWVNPPK